MGKTPLTTVVIDTEVPILSYPLPQNREVVISQPKSRPSDMLKFEQKAFPDLETLFNPLNNERLQ